MKRTPIYSKDESHRVISVANGLWTCQRFAGRRRDRGTGLTIKDNTFDPWVNYFRPTDYTTALSQLKGVAYDGPDSICRGDL